MNNVYEDAPRKKARLLISKINPRHKIAADFLPLGVRVSSDEESVFLTFDQVEKLFGLVKDDL